MRLLIANVKQFLSGQQWSVGCYWCAGPNKLKYDGHIGSRVVGKRWWTGIWYYFSCALFNSE